MDLFDLKPFKQKLEDLESDLEIAIRILKNLPEHGIFFETHEDLLGSFKQMKEKTEFYLAELKEGEAWKKM